MLRATHTFRNSAILATAATIAISAASTGAILGIAGGRLGGREGANSLRPASTDNSNVWSPPVALSVAAAEAATVATTEGTAFLATKSNGRQAPLLGDSGAPGDSVGPAPQMAVAQGPLAGDAHEQKKGKSDKKNGVSGKKAKESGKKAKESDKKPKKSSDDSDKKSKKDHD